ncbi:MAG: sugar nucleotide-binding protein [Bacteroidota bacterium]
MRNIAIIGANGMLGFAASEYFESRGYIVQRITRKDYDIVLEPIAALEQMLFDADIVVNCAGISKEKIAEYSTEDIFKINSVFPRNLALFCKQAGIKCFHLTSEHVFSGERGNYSEDDPIDANELFGMSKHGGESSLCMTLRTSIIGEEQDDNNSLIEWAKQQQGQTVDGIVNHFWNGVTTIHLAEIIEKIIENDAYAEGVFHLFSPNTVSKKELLEILNDAFGLHLKIVPAESSYYNDRTLTSNYPISRLFCTKTIHMQVYEMKEFFELARVHVSAA